ncbi:MAG TPA: sigma-70 family RNA polymerase sigma factor [Candidatus Dormibacteraeota bacterium]|jgi:RNA polymerase sigma-70 factor (ECF subfamily)|nr:sigma-70 family RNA polymerase sigma factor [Candidatus Dormibacteraeota bacterium]
MTRAQDAERRSGRAHGLAADPAVDRGRLDDSQLARRLAERDVDALAVFYDRYGGLAYSIALRILGDTGRAEDVVQDVFLKIWRAAPGFDPARGQLRTWLITAVRNRSVDYLRGRGAYQRRELELSPELATTGSDPWEQVSLSLEQDAVREALISLPAEQRQVVELAYFSGYTGGEIAGMIDAPLSTVKGRMRLALEKLRSYLQGRGLEVDV